MVDLDKPDFRVPVFRIWMKKNNIKVLNVAGPRESQAPGISAQAAECLRQLLERRKRPRDRR